jgi:hypothetical protein
MSVALLLAVQPASPVAGLAAVAGYAWALIAGGVLIPLAMGTTTFEGEAARRSLHQGAVGLVERTLYVTAVFEGRPELIVGWLVLKGALSWSRRPGEPGLSNRFLVEAGLSLLFGVSGGAVALHLGEAGNEWVVVGYVVLPLILCGMVAALSATWAPSWLLRMFHPGEANRRQDRALAAVASVAGGDLDAEGDGRGDGGDGEGE